MDIIINHVRLRPTKDTLIFLLKNTHFTAENLIPDHIGFSFEMISSLPLLIFKFKDASKSFLYPLNYFNLKNGEMGWLDHERITLKLELSDSVIADQISEIAFLLNSDQTQEVRIKLNEQLAYTPEAINLLEDFAQTNIIRYLG